MTNNIPNWIEEKLAADPCLCFLGQTFRCIDGVFADPVPLVETFGCVPLYLREYTLIEIRFTTEGFVGNFRELLPGKRNAGFNLQRFAPVKGAHPDRLLRTEQSMALTRARFATAEYEVPGLDKVRYGTIQRPRDGAEIHVYHFDPRLLDLMDQRQCGAS